MESTTRYQEGSLTLTGAVAMGTGVMIGAGIFALTGQVAEYSGPWFPIAFLVAALVSGFSAYTYVKVTNRYPSAGGIAMILQKAYGRSTVTGAAALLMAFSMVINESLVARTFATYALRLFNFEGTDWLVPVLAVGLIFAAFLVNVAGNTLVEVISKIAALLKIGGIALFAVAVLVAAGFSFQPAEASSSALESGPLGFLAGVALAILAFKGFTTITNSGGEIENPHRNVGRAIIISLGICLVIYLLVAFAVGSSLSIPEIVAARDYSLAEAARPAFGNLGVTFTVVIAVIATASGVIASIFAVSRMTTMLTDMRLIPHRHFGLPGNVQRHMLVYTVVFAGLLAALFDLGRIASLGAIFYLVMDVIIHWGVMRKLHAEISARTAVLIAAIVFDLVALGAFVAIKWQSDPLIILIGASGIALIFLLEFAFLKLGATRGTAAVGHDD